MCRLIPDISFNFLQHTQVGMVARLGNLAFLDRKFDRAARFIQVKAIAETAVVQAIAHLRKQGREFRFFKIKQLHFPEARGINDFPAKRQFKHLRKRGGMLPTSGKVTHIPDLEFQFRCDEVDGGRFARPRTTDEKADLALKNLPDFVGIAFVLG